MLEEGDTYSSSLEDFVEIPNFFYVMTIQIDKIGSSGSGARVSPYLRS